MGCSHSQYRDTQVSENKTTKCDCTWLTNFEVICYEGGTCEESREHHVYRNAKPTWDIALSNLNVLNLSSCRQKHRTYEHQSREKYKNRRLKWWVVTISCIALSTAASFNSNKLKLHWLYWYFTAFYNELKNRKIPLPAIPVAFSASQDTL